MEEPNVCLVVRKVTGIGDTEKEDELNVHRPLHVPTRICLIGEIGSDAKVFEAAQAFKIPIVKSESAMEFLNDGSFDTVFVTDEFEGPLFEAIHQSEQRILGPTALQELADKGESLPSITRPLYCRAMVGLNICFTGFHKKEELNRLVQMIRYMGGSIRKEMGSKVTHLIAESRGGEKYQYAVTFRVPVMAESWVYACWEARNTLGISAASPEMMAHKQKPFYKARVRFLGFPEEEQQHMAEVLQENGGTAVSSSDPVCTHVVVSGCLQNTRLMVPKEDKSLPKPSKIHTSTPSSQRKHPLSSLSVSDYESPAKTRRLSKLSIVEEGASLASVYSEIGEESWLTATPTPTAIKTHRLSISEAGRGLEATQECPPHANSSLQPLKVDNFSIPFACPTQSFSFAKPSMTVADSSSSFLVVDESTIQTVPEGIPRKAYIVKVEWFWASVQNEACACEREYLFEDYLEDLLSPGRMSNSQLSASSASRARKRKRMRDNRHIIHTEAPGVHKRRSSVSEAGLLSSFLDSSTASEKSGEVLDGDLTIDTPRKGASAREQVFLELVQTEQNYVGILNTIMTVFKDPLEAMSENGDVLLNNTELKIIFGNLQPIYDVHRNMLQELRESALHWKEDAGVGSIILKYAPELMKAYPSFVNCFETTREMLVKCDQTKPRFHAFLKIGQTKPECGRQSLQELLIRPVQRLPSMGLLLGEIVKHTPKSNSDHAALEQALRAVQEVMTHINEDKRRTEGQRVMFDIFNDIENCPPHLVSSHRSFVVRCEVTALSDGLSKRGRCLVFFLFSDTIEVCKKRSKSFKSPNRTGSLQSVKITKPYKHISLIPLSTIKKVIDVQETKDCHNAFALLCRNNHEFQERQLSFMLVDETIKSEFLRTLTRQIANTLCRTDVETFLSTVDSEALDIDTSEEPYGTLSKAFKRTKQKVGRAFSFSKTPTNLKRAVSSMMSPFGSSHNLTPNAQLSEMRIASCNNLYELDTSAKAEASYEAPMSVQPTRKNKVPPMNLAALRRL